MVFVTFRDSDYNTSSSGLQAVDWLDECIVTSHFIIWFSLFINFFTLFNKYQGVPIRVELGPRDVSNGQVVMVRRDTGEKLVFKAGEAASKAAEVLESIHTYLYDK